MDRGAWQATIHGVAQSWTRLKQLSSSSSDGKEYTCNAGDPGFDPWVGKTPWRRKWQPTPVLLPGEFHGRRSLVGYSPWDRKELDTTA